MMKFLKEKPLIINMVSQFVALLVNLGISLLLTPIIVNKIGENAYGFVGLANDFITYAQIMTIALNSMAGRFITISIHKEDYDSANEYFSSVFIANILISIFLTFIGVLIVCFLPNLIEVPIHLLNDVKMLFLFIISNFIVSIISSVFGVATFATNKLYLQAKKKIESYVIKALILTLTYLFFTPFLWYVGLATLISTIYSSVIDIYYTKKYLPKIILSIKKFNIKKIKELLMSGIWNSISKLSSLLSNGLDLLISNKFVGSIGMGFLSISKNLPVMILSVFNLLASVFSPDLTISYAKKDFNNMKQQLIKSIKILSAFACIPVTFLFIYGLPFYKLWIPNTDYNLVYGLSILTSMGMIFSLPFEGLWNIFTVTNKVKTSSIVLILNSILSISIVFILLPIFDGQYNIQLCIIAGVSSIFSIIRNLTFLPIYGAICINERKTTFYPALGRYIVTLLITMGIGIVVKNILLPTSWIKLIVCCAITSIFSLIISFMVLLSKEEKTKIYEKLNDFIFRRES